MEWGTIVGTITALGSLITALGLFLANLKVLLPIKKQIHIVHTIVNQEATDRKRYQAVLERALTMNGIELPEDQSKSLDGGP
jgi:hypothetical protein